MFEYERVQTKEKDSLNVYPSMHICAHVCVCERQWRIQKEALPQVGPVNGLTSLRLKRTRHYKSHVAHKTALLSALSARRRHSVKLPNEKMKVSPSPFITNSSVR